MSFVYFLQADNGPIKIGMATKLDNRIRSLQTATFHNLKLIHTEEHDDFIIAKKEKEYHMMFSKYNIRGEWFEPEGIIEYLEGERIFKNMIQLFPCFEIVHKLHPRKRVWEPTTEQHREAAIRVIEEVKRVLTPEQLGNLRNTCDWVCKTA